MNTRKRDSIRIIEVMYKDSLQQAQERDRGQETLIACSFAQYLRRVGLRGETNGCGWKIGEKKISFSHGRQIYDGWSTWLPCLDLQMCLRGGGWEAGEIMAGREIAATR